MRQSDGDVSLLTALQLPARPDRGPRLRPQATLNQGESGFISLTWAAGRWGGGWQKADDDLASTISFWRDWLSTGTLPDHPWRPHPRAQRADPQGAELRADRGDHGRVDDQASPKTPGGARNWDYRYTWIRDTGFTLRALYRLGYDWEAMEYFAFILYSVRGKRTSRSPSPSCKLCTAYLAGESETSPRKRSTTSRAGATPSRSGSATARWNQHQNDVWGMLVDAVDSHTPPRRRADHQAGLGGSGRFRR